jgi:hypothetical protein
MCEVYDTNRADIREKVYDNRGRKVLHETEIASVFVTKRAN